MLKLLMLAAGGGIGTLLRYFISGLAYKFTSGIFPVGTLIVNALGSLAIGVLWAVFEQVYVSSTVRMCVLIGLLGGFTTFSTFSLESFNLLREGEFKMAVANIVMTNIICIFFVFAGFTAARWLLQSMK